MVGTGRVPRRAILAWLAATLFLLGIWALILLAVLVIPQHLVQSSLPQGAPITVPDRLKAENDIRTTMLQGIGGLLLTLGALATWRQVLIAKNQVLVNAQANLTDAMSKAVEQLQSHRTHAQIGGIYALDRIAGLEFEERARVAHIVGSFIREQDLVDGQVAEPAEVAIRLIGSWPWKVQALSLSNAKLVGSDLARLKLSGANLENAQLHRANLEGADLSRARMRGADLTNSRLASADLSGADLTDANLMGAQADQSTMWPLAFNATDRGVSILT